jgi:hypothetical protein
MSTFTVEARWRIQSGGRRENLRRPGTVALDGLINNEENVILLQLP